MWFFLLIIAKEIVRDATIANIVPKLKAVFVSIIPNKPIIEPPTMLATMIRTR